MDGGGGMARILVSFYQPILGGNCSNLVCYYEGLVKELARFDNHVLTLNVATFFLKKNQRQVLSDVLDFKPELAVAFNNQIPPLILKQTECPVLLVDADTVDFFANRDAIRRYNDRYFGATFYEGFEGDLVKIGVKKQRVFTLHPATAVQRQDVLQDKNISFIGSTFSRYNPNTVGFLKRDERRAFYGLLCSFWASGGGDCRVLLEKEGMVCGLSALDLYEMFDARNYVLSSVLDLGLSLYGPGWMSVASSNYALASACERRSVFSLAHNQEIYNSSKLNLSVSHPQARGIGFPWRIYDIMASGGILVSSRADLLRSLTSGYVDIPMYDSPFDARELCRKCLGDPILRRDVVAASNAFIEKHGRWPDNFRMIEAVTGVKILGVGGGSQRMAGYALEVPAKPKRRLKRALDVFLFLADSIADCRLFLSSSKIRRLVYTLEEFAENS